jgi:hypothetical protein
MIEFRDVTYTFQRHAPAFCLAPARPDAPADNPGEKGFTVILTLAEDFIPVAGILAELPGAFRLEVRLAGVGPEHASFDSLQHYLNHTLEDGSCPVMEATLFLHSELHPDWTELRVGFPLSLIGTVKGNHEIAVHFTGARLQLFADSRLMDENFPFGQTRAAKGAHFRIDPARVQAAELYPEALPLSETVAMKRDGRAIQYFLPRGFNTWIGDVVTFFHDGRFHIFYLLDRRHHTSKFGQGGHIFEHLSSLDLKNWTEHECAVDIDQQWETCGTGTPFYLNGKYYFAYGLHTTRMIPHEQTTLPMIEDHIKAHGSTALFKQTDLAGYPAGAALSESDDGIHFRKTGLLIHSAENPSVFARKNGGLLLLFDGVWTTDDMKRWSCINPAFPPHEQTAALRNSLECPCLFEWNGHYYAMAGQTGFWHSQTDSFEAFTDLAAQGEDIYEGLGIPMVAEFGAGRRIMAGWPECNRTFGSCLVFRELIQHADGRLGLKWLKEVLPETAEPVLLADRFVPGASAAGSVYATAAFGDSFLVEMRVRPGAPTGVLAVRFAGSDPDIPGGEFQIRFGEGRAQWNVAPQDGFASPILPAHELFKAAGPAVESFLTLPTREHLHMYAGNFCIDRVRGLAEPFSLKLLVTYMPRMETTLIDVEIAGQRTMLSSRRRLRVDRLSFMSSNPGLTIRDLSIAKQKGAGR